MNLSIKDRLVLKNQYRILEALNPDEKEFYERASKILEFGFELEYDMLTRNIDSDVVTIQECEEVIDILDMFDALRICYARLEDNSGIDEYQVRFLGFDGNHEAKQLLYARYLKKDGRFADLENIDSNSHLRVLPIYRRMLAEWNRSDNKYELSKDDIMRITNARSITNLIKQNGVFSEDDKIDELREMIYQSRGRSETEEAIS